MLLIYSENTSTRLQYTCKLIFEELLKTSYSISIHKESFAAHEGIKINYSRKHFDNAYQISPAALLFEEGIKKQQLNISGQGKDTVLFKNDAGDHSFDIFAAVFYLISRYEEYLPHEKDMYGRFAHQNSVAYQNVFLKFPVVNIWIKDLADKISNYFSKQSLPGLNAVDGATFNLQPSTFNFQPTYDIDIAWSYREKGFLRNAAGFLKNPAINRITALLGLSNDPFSSYAFLDKLHEQYGLHPKYFFLIAEKNGIYDKNILPSNKKMQQLIKVHSVKYEIGLHPSWRSNEIKALLKEERSLLENIAGQPITISRQHYIKAELPGTYLDLIAAGITNDYSMGYGSINGFRASVASSFYWYDLAAEKITGLRIHPFCFMDANAFYEEKLSATEAYTELLNYTKECREVNGTLITVFHNNFLGTDRQFKGWPEMYAKFIAQVQRSSPSA